MCDCGGLCIACKRNATLGIKQLTPPKVKRIRERTEEEKRAVRDRAMVRKYNITRQEFEAVAAIQGYRCSICNEVRKLTIDHDHNCCGYGSSCGRCIRGLICSHCNSILGMADDNTAILSAASAYLNRAAELSSY